MMLCESMCMGFFHVCSLQTYATFEFSAIFIFLFSNVFKLCTSEFVCSNKLVLSGTSENSTEKLKSNNINLDSAPFKMSGLYKLEKW